MDELKNFKNVEQLEQLKILEANKELQKKHNNLEIKYNKLITNFKDYDNTIKETNTILQKKIDEGFLTN